jgi:NAD(P)-dependent dehydrogenase (short-subunit alcohol dehydrogenase family)
VINQIVEAGGKAFAVRADISDEAQVLAMFDSLDREGEPLTALVNNAGILFEQSTIEPVAERINRVGDQRHGLFPLLPGSGKTHVLQTWRHGASECLFAAARLGAPGEYVDYAASKGAVDTLTTGLRWKWRRRAFA